MLETYNLKTGYSHKSIIGDIPDLSISRDTPLGIAGINGAGKTTFLKTLAGVLPIISGEIVFTTQNSEKLLLNNHVDMENFRGILGYCPDVGGLIPAATPNEHVNILLNLIPKQFREAAQKKAETVFENMGVAEVADVPCGTFSHGMMRRTSVALAYVNAYDIIILDEPFDGVDPEGVRRIQTIIKQCREDNVGVIVSSHLINILSETVDNILIMAGQKFISLQPSAVFQGVEGLTKYDNIIKEKSVR